MARRKPIHGSEALAAPMGDTELLISELRQGRMVILLDDEDRENEGDLAMAACFVKPEDVNFMARHGRGLICLTLTPEYCERFDLKLMGAGAFSTRKTNFTVSVDAAHGVSTGISAADRAHTIRTTVNPEAGPRDLVQPGHIFPLMAHSGGVLVRAGHTEAGCDLARLAGLPPAAVIVEILNEDGSMARRPQLEKFAQRHGLRMGTIAELIRFRIRHEKTVVRRAACDLQTEFGMFRLVVYEDRIEGGLHIALTHGQPRPEDLVLVRVHIHNLLFDLSAALGDLFGRPLRDALQRIAAAKTGVLVVLCNQYDPNALIEQVQRLDAGGKQERDAAQGEVELRTYGLGAQILSDLGVRRMRVLGSPLKMHGLSGFGLEVEEYVS